MSDSGGSDFEFQDDDFSLDSKKSGPKPKAAPKPKVTKAPAAPKQTKLKMTKNDDLDNFDPEKVFESIDHATHGGKQRVSIESIYQKLSQLDHVLQRPDSYIGTTDLYDEKMWVYDMREQKMVNRNITYSPGLYKIFDEILVNAADNKQRDPKMNCIKIDINREKNEISIYNNGRGIPVVEHKVEKIYVPELIFGTLLTSSNFNDDEKKTTGGRNGFGAKLCNIFSKKFVVETSSKEFKKSYKQTWTNNMNKDAKPSEHHKPKIDVNKSEDFTKITFQPDLARFKLTELDDDHVDLMARRAYDVAGVSRGVRVMLNGTRLPCTGFEQYVDQYLKDSTDEVGNAMTYSYERANERWEYAVTHSDTGFQQISFVNGIATTKGGEHVDYVTDKFVAKIIEHIRKQLKKSGAAIKPNQVKQHLWVFVNALIENPTFGSQTKETMTLKSKHFGSTCELGEKFITKAIKQCKIVDTVLAWVMVKQQAQLNQKCAGTKQSRLKGLPKLEDANEAGTRNSLQCTLILTEGDSAKTLAVAGLGVIGRDYYGVFPLRGKLLNVRDANKKQIMENAEINNIIKIVGLQYKKDYSTEQERKSLRYGKIMIMADQDQDGSHIKGLIINFIQHNWPSLLRNNFIEEFITPIVKVTKGDQERSMYSLPEYEEWRAETPNWQTWKIRYYKGLGTSTSKEAKEYFENMLRHQIRFRYAGAGDDMALDLAFGKTANKADARKEWLTQFMEDRKHRREIGLPDIYLYERDTKDVSIQDFVNKELVLFSSMDNERSIPSLVDGFKPGQRKVMFTCFKRNLKRELKVAQLAGSVAEMSAYHHGEVSLQMTIVNLAQNYVGSNNINLLLPIGQFGTRLMGGKDSASARYIFTQLNPVTRSIFPVDDEPLLNYLTDDNKRIEPDWYCPVIPMVLVNGAEGIGTGWSTKVPNHNPLDLVHNLKRMLNDEEPVKLVPWYRGFRGEIDETGENRYATSGEVGMLDDYKFEITELPVGSWTQNYKEQVMQIYLEGSEKIKPCLNDFKEYHTDVTVRFVVNVKPENWNDILAEGIHKRFKLQSSLATSFMILYDSAGVLTKYESSLDILKDFYKVRLDLYEKRKHYLLGMLEAEASRLSEQARFILMKIKWEIIMENKKKAEIVKELIKNNFKRDPVAVWKAEMAKKKKAAEIVEEDGDEETTSDETVPSEAEKELTKGYEYLVNLSLIKLSMEEKDRMERERDAKRAECSVLRNKTPKDLWLEDLAKFETEYRKWLDQEAEEQQATAKPIASGNSGKARKGGKKTKAGMMALKDTLPSDMAERVAPPLEHMKVKVEAAAKAKANKGQKKVKVEVEEDGEENVALKDRLLKKQRLSGQSGSPLPDAKSLKRFMTTAAAKAKTEPVSDDTGTPSPDKAKTGTKRKMKVEDSDDDDEVSSSKRTSPSISDDDDEWSAPVVNRSPSMRAKKPVAYKFELDEIEDDDAPPTVETDEDFVEDLTNGDDYGFSNTENNRPPKKSASDLYDDLFDKMDQDDAGPSKPSNKKKGKYGSDSDISDVEFIPEVPKSKQRSPKKPAAPKSTAATKKMGGKVSGKSSGLSNGKSSKLTDIFSSLPTVPKKLTNGSSEDSGSNAGRSKPKTVVVPKKQPPVKKRSAGSDSSDDGEDDSFMNDDDDADSLLGGVANGKAGTSDLEDSPVQPPRAPAGGRSRKPVSYKIESDDEDDDDDDFC